MNGIANRSVPNYALPIPIPPMRHLPSLFVILLSTLAATMTLLWWEGRQARQALANQNEALLAEIAQEVAFRQTANGQLLGEMHQFIENEVLLHDDRKNDGLHDTLTQIHEQALALLGEHQADPSALRDWHQELQAILAASVSFVSDLPTHLVEPPDAIDSPDLHNLYVLRTEWNVLSILIQKLGTAGCTLPRALTVVMPDTIPTIPLGRPFKAHLFVTGSDWQQISLHNRYHHHTTMGSIQRDASGDPRPLLLIPTEDLLAPGRQKRLIPFTITTRLPRATGGHEVIETKGSFWVEREK